MFSFIKIHTHDIEAMHYMAIEILKANGQDIRIKKRNFYQLRNYLFRKLYFYSDSQ